MKTNIVIIGAGQAGIMAAISLRKVKYNGKIVLFTDEKYFPYQRPPLSKGYLSEKIQEKNLYFKTNTFYEKNDIQIIRNTKVTAINRETKTILTNNKQEYSYDKLIISTGSTIRKLNFTCNEENIFYLRTLDDANKIRERLGQLKSMVIIGAGYIGLETAAILTKKNIEVTIIEMEKRVMKRSVCKTTSLFFQEKHRAEGVNLKLNVSVTDINDHKDQKRVIASDGSIIDADAVLIGVGVKPNADLAINSGLLCENGILVNQCGKTSDDDIYAAGDCTNHLNTIYHKRINLESVHNAMEQAKTVAATINGSTEPWDQVPRFWSNQYDLKLQIAGISDDFEQCVIRGKMEDNKFSIFYLKAHKVIALDSINDNKTFLHGKKIIAAKKSIPIEILADSNSDLKKVISSDKKF